MEEGRDNQKGGGNIEEAGDGDECRNTETRRAI
jgi:hypothetical protein